ncbi:hypothetical protein [Ruminococcus sp.]|jgi:hypothetical protein|uniref:hypothetical protein n=1 Tax=Ruminococcus sp. TaxID=41978 RepID=UPI0025E268AE|nr:hypothetical protein [Ruminococcus sp.]
MCTNNSENEHILTILINTKYSRITVHKNTLDALGDPAFIQLAYNSKKRMLMLLSAAKQAQNTIRVIRKQHGFCLIHSKSFMFGLMSVSKAIKEQGTYLLKGKMDKQLSAAYFSLDNAERVIEPTDRGN